MKVFQPKIFSIFKNYSGHKLANDVLAGLIAGLLAYSKKPLETVALAAYLHGRAGDALAKELSHYGVTPSDLPTAIARELSSLEKLLK